MFQEVDSLRDRLDAKLSDPSVQVEIETLTSLMKERWADEETRDLRHAGDQMPGVAELIRENYFLAVSHVYQAVLGSRQLSEDLLKEFQGLLFNGVDRLAIVRGETVTELPIEAGQYRTGPCHIDRGNSYRLFPPPGKVQEEMVGLLAWYGIGQDQLHPATLAAHFHAKFLDVHPFPDGNGRAARLAASFILLKSGYPPLILKGSEGDAYVSAVVAAQDEGDYRPLVRVMAAAVSSTTRDLLERITLG